MDDQKKHWPVRVIRPLRMTNDDGSLVDISPGEYTLSEAEGARYRLSPQSDNRVCQSLWYTELLLSAYTGQVEILGVWP